MAGMRTTQYTDCLRFYFKFQKQIKHERMFMNLFTSSCLLNMSNNLVNLYIYDIAFRQLKQVQKDFLSVRHLQVTLEPNISPHASHVSMNRWIVAPGGTFLQKCYTYIHYWNTPSSLNILVMKKIPIHAEELLLFCLETLVI